jgi:hypothetical protein
MISETVKILLRRGAGADIAPVAVPKAAPRIAINLAPQAVEAQVPDDNILKNLLGNF